MAADQLLLLLLRVRVHSTQHTELSTSYTACDAVRNAQRAAGSVHDAVAVASSSE
jgi:hypothetical protein